MGAGDIDRAGPQRHQTEPSDAAHQIGILHLRQSAIAAELAVKPFGDQQTLIAIGQRQQPGTQIRLGFGPPRFTAEILQREMKHGCAWPLRQSLRHEGFHFHFPALLQGRLGDAVKKAASRCVPLLAPAINCALRLLPALMIWAPAASTISNVASDDPPSATITSRTTPRTAAQSGCRNSAAATVRRPARG